MKKITTIVILMFAVLILVESTNAQTKKLRFRKGASSATVKGVVQCDRVGTPLYYVLGAKKGQKLIAYVSGANARVIDRNGSETYLESDILEYVYPYSGDVKIYVYYECSGSTANMLKYGVPKTRYSLKVLIE